MDARRACTCSKYDTQARPVTCKKTTNTFNAFPKSAALQRQRSVSKLSSEACGDANHAVHISAWRRRGEIICYDSDRVEHTPVEAALVGQTETAYRS
jgi:hypothetical protein